MEVVVDGTDILERMYHRNGCHVFCVVKQCYCDLQQKLCDVASCFALSSYHHNCTFAHSLQQFSVCYTGNDTPAE